MAQVVWNKVERILADQVTDSGEDELFDVHSFVKQVGASMVG